MSMSWTGGALSRRFAEIQQLFDEYYGKERDRGGDELFDWMIEATERLKQLVHILTRLEALQAYRDEDPADRDRDEWTEMQTYTEAFYWIAFRLQHVMEKLPGLSFKAVGVRDVRNHLLEHPEKKDSGVIFGVIGLQADVGPVIKARRRLGTDAKWTDAGLKPNAEEYALKLERVLRAHIGAKD
jgi:hypothetical protein